MLVRPAFGVDGKNEAALREYFLTFRQDPTLDIPSVQQKYLIDGHAVTELTPDELSYLSPLFGFDEKKKVVEDREIARWLFPDIHTGIGGGEAYIPDRKGKNWESWLEKALALGVVGGMVFAGCGCIHFGGDDSGSKQVDDSYKCPSDSACKISTANEPNVVWVYNQGLESSNLEGPSQFPNKKYECTVKWQEHTKNPLDVSEIERLIFEKTNAERANYGLPPLAWDDTLAHIADDHNGDMAEHSFLEHNGSDGKDATQRAEEHGYNVRKVTGQENFTKKTREGAKIIWEIETITHYKKGIGENIMLTGPGYTRDKDSPETELRYVKNTPDDLAFAFVDGWMDSSGHRANILNQGYENIGIGVVYNGDGVYYATQDFF